LTFIPVHPIIELINKQGGVTDMVNGNCCFQVGDKIIHKVFGKGVILDIRFDDFSMRKYRIEEYLLDINFSDYGNKTLSFNLCKESDSLRLISDSTDLIAS
jgi:hypothetical protein